MTLLITGGSGFIGTNFLQQWLASETETVINLDKLTYAAGVKDYFDGKSDALNYEFINGDINNKPLVEHILTEKAPRAIINFAAESHVDRSIATPDQFIETNINGTFNLLKCSLSYWRNLSLVERKQFRFFQISTDEVFGSLSIFEPASVEASTYKPNSPYSASKAAGDHLVRSFNKTYGLPTLLSNCSNNYGPFQNPEKLIPKIIRRALSQREIPVYGDGKQIRDWLHVSDHVDAILAILNDGEPGVRYNVGGNNQIENIDLISLILDYLDYKEPLGSGKSYKSLITFVEDRLGHDRRYHINLSKIQRDLSWQPKTELKSGLEETIDWYIENPRFPY